MAHDQSSTPPPSRPGRPELWRKQRMVQRVPAHLGESTRESVSPWITIGGVILLIAITCAVIFTMLGGSSRLGALGFGASPTRTRTATSVSPPLTRVPVTLPLSTPTPGPTAVTIKYRVKPGDTLSFIAERYHVSVRAIMAANGLKDETIRIGEELIIPLPTPTPPGGASAPQLPSTPTPIAFESPPSTADAAVTPGVIRYTVRSGDTLIGIAVVNGSTVNAIRIANELDGDTIVVGQVLMVPVGAWTPSPAPTQTSNATPLPTSQFAYPAPNLKFPPDNHAFRGSKDVPFLEWLSPAILKPNEFYVVHVEYVTGGVTKSYPITVRQGTSLKLDPAQYYPGPTFSGTRYSWYVVIVSQPAGAQPLAQSPLSATRTFLWY